MFNQNQILANTKGVFMALLVFTFWSPAAGQINESDTMKVQVRAGFNGIRQTGNVDLGILRTRLELVVRFTDAIVYKSQNNMLYQEFNRRKADNDLNSRNYLYYHPSKKLYPFAMAFIQSNFRLKIKQRIFWGAGMTCQIISTSNHSLKTSASLVYENTNYNVNEFNDAFYSGKNSISIWRPTFYLSGIHKLSNTSIRLHYGGYWQPGLDNVSNQRFQLEAGAEMNIWKGLAVTILYLYSFEEIVPLRVKQNDTLLTIGFSYHFRK